MVLITNSLCLVNTLSCKYNYFPHISWFVLLLLLLVFTNPNTTLIQTETVLQHLIIFFTSEVSLLHCGDINAEVREVTSFSSCGGRSKPPVPDLPQRRSKGSCFSSASPARLFSLSFFSKRVSLYGGGFLVFSFLVLLGPSFLFFPLRVCVWGEPLQKKLPVLHSLAGYFR